MKHCGKLLSLLLTLIMVLVMIPGTVVTASAETCAGRCSDTVAWALADDGTLTFSGSGAISPVQYWTDQITLSNARSVKTITLAQGITSIESAAFFMFENCTTLSVSASVDQIAGGLFRDGSLQRYTVSADNPRYCSDSAGALYEKDMSCLIAFPVDGPSVYAVPEGVTLITSYAFSGSTKLIEVTLPDSLAQIGPQVFFGCTGLSEITIPENVWEISSQAFGSCLGLKTIRFAGHAPDTMRGDVFAGVTATAYYPPGDDTWTEDVMQDYGGSITWIASGSGIWKKDSKGWWYQNPDGSYPRSCWQKIDGKWYHFDVSGYMQTGWLKDGGKWYYLTSSGDMVTGWKQIGGKWYYFTCSGDMVTGWKQLSGKWYYFTSSGNMVSGWKQLSGKWYYFTGSGDMVTGWKQLGGTWYYFTGSGDMVTGWKQISGTWYYFESSGAMLADTSRTIGGKTYYFSFSGACTNP